MLSELCPSHTYIPFISGTLRFLSLSLFFRTLSYTISNIQTSYFIEEFCPYLMFAVRCVRPPALRFLDGFRGLVLSPVYKLVVGLV